jgi:hypothetical protein
MTNIGHDSPDGDPARSRRFNNRPPRASATFMVSAASELPFDMFDAEGRSRKSEGGAARWYHCQITREIHCYAGGARTHRYPLTRGVASTITSKLTSQFIARNLVR